MRKSAPNLVGEVFFGWIVIDRDTTDHGKSTAQYWIIACDSCKATKVRCTADLKRNHIGTCMCKVDRVVRNDHTGSRLGTFTAIRVATHAESKNKVKWLSVCDCGAELFIRADNFKYNKVPKCCVCYVKEIKPKPLPRGCQYLKYKYLEGTSINKLSILEVLPAAKVVNWHIRARVKCECGKEYETNLADILREDIKSCGCIQTPDLTGLRFGTLVALHKGTPRDFRTTWVCQCDCGNLNEVRAAALIAGTTTSCGCVGLAKLLVTSKLYSGKNHPMYNANITDEERAIRRNTDAYRQWRMSVYRRDNFTCQRCGKKGEMRAHHIVPYSKSRELRHELSNGMTLCKECHALFHAAYSQNNYNIEEFNRFMGEITDNGFRVFCSRAGANQRPSYTKINRSGAGACPSRILGRLVKLGGTLASPSKLRTSRPVTSCKVHDQVRHQVC